MGEVNRNYSDSEGYNVELELISAIMQQQTSNRSGGVPMSMFSVGSGGSSGEFSLLMSAMLYRASEQSAGTGANAAALYSALGGDAFNPAFATLTGYGGAQAPIAAPAFDQSRYPLETWVRCSPTITGSAAARSPELLQAVIEQFRVTTNKRYEPGRNGYTYCNIYVLDVMHALGVELPQLKAAAMEKWLESDAGRIAGWREVDAATAQAYANSGRPAMTSMGGNSHVQVVVPERDGEFNAVRGVAISQAGAVTHDYTHQVRIPSLRYWVHD
ncbi:MAG: hypothetical protein LBC65_06265 [Oscillospiraceae bacterium]|jgi:hypothetical protein|nr:hypothetical protein [Oscillospiraceae bacterium]